MATAPAPRPRSKAVMWTGLMLGTALAILAMTDGVRLKVGHVPPFLGWILGGLLTWLLVVGAATVVAELLRRHHRALGRHAGQGVGRGWRLARRYGGRGLAAAARAADRRWQARQADPHPGPAREPVDLGAVLNPARWLAARGQAAGTGPAADPNPTPPDGIPALPPARPGTAAGGWGEPDPAREYGTGPWLLAVRRKDGQPYYDGPGGSRLGTVIVDDPDDLRRRLDTAVGDPDTEVRVAPVKASDGPHSGTVPLPHDSVTVTAGRRDDGAAIPVDGAVPPADATGNHPHGGTDMSNRTTSDEPVDYWPNYSGPRPAGLQRRTARTAAAPEPNGVWKQVISSTHGFEPENDSHLLGWMAGEAGGMSGYAEEIADVYETAVNTIGLDPIAMAALHDYADAAATAAEAMAKARQRFADHYAEVRAFAASGGVLPYNGRWMTGEGD
jgi:hypothetical protein